MSKPKEARVVVYNRPAGGWGSVQAVEEILRGEKVIAKGARVLFKQNKPGGFACVSCSWAKPADPHLFEFCENGAKATAWEITSKRATPEFFERHTLSVLEKWSDLALESEGRLTEPLKYDPQSDRYLRVSWKQAFEEIGAELTALRLSDPKKVVFYASGRASLETSYMYGLMARLYGNNNLPDSSNMCHESTSVALPQTIGVPVGTVTLEDFEHTDAFFFFGHNTGTNAPRMLHPLQEARKRNAQIITFNPIKERGLVSFVNPQSPKEMLSPTQTPISTQYHQVKIGGDIAAVSGLCKALIEADDRAQIRREPPVLDHAFIAEHTHGFEEFKASMRAATWESIELASALTREAIQSAAQVYADAKAAMILYGMGITQHREGVLAIHMLTNLMLLRGNIGKKGAGICPIRGHSNVQGQRTVGITEKPELVPMEKLRELYHFEPPQEKGLTTVETCEALRDGQLTAFVGLGGNFARAIPDQGVLDPLWKDVPLTVQIATKLNRSHVLHGRAAYLLPCLGRIERDGQETGEQIVTVEDSTACIHSSRGMVEPASANLMSEPAIVAELAKAILPPNASIDWDAWVADYSLIRDAIEKTYPEQFKGFNERMDQPGGFHRPIAAAHREWKTKNGRANFMVPDGFGEDPDMDFEGACTLRLMTTRGDSQFNTTVYSLDDRFRGVFGTRDVLLMNAHDITRLKLTEGEMVTACTVSDDQVDREVKGLRVHAFDIPTGCVMGYYPECNRLIPIAHHAKGSQVPAAKAIPIRLKKVLSTARA